MRLEPSPATRLAIRAAMIPGIGRARLHGLVSGLPDPTDPDAWEARLASVATSRVKAQSMVTAWSEAADVTEVVLRNAIAADIGILSALDPVFPDCLRSIPQSPFFMTCRGNMALGARGGLLDQGCGIAVVGKRQASDAGRGQTRWLIRQIAGCDPQAIIVSGLAQGIDHQAHLSALEYGLPTVAVLAGDLRAVYPPEHADTAAALLAAGGLLLSESLPVPNPEINPGLMVDRDRLQSALARLVIAVECGETSGTMHTMRFAALQGRRLAAVGYKDPRHSPGTRALIEGRAEAGRGALRKPVGAAAIPIGSVDDLRRALNIPADRIV